MVDGLYDEKECLAWNINGLSRNLSDVDFVRRFQNYIDGFLTKCLSTVYNVGSKALLLQGLSEPEFYGDLVYKFRKIIGKIDFPYHFKKIIVCEKKIAYNIDVCDKLHACFLIKSTLLTLLTSSIARQ